MGVCTRSFRGYRTADTGNVFPGGLFFPDLGLVLGSLVATRSGLPELANCLWRHLLGFENTRNDLRDIRNEFTMNTRRWEEVIRGSQREYGRDGGGWGGGGYGSEVLGTFVSL